jgi:hypothetical protein
LIRVVGPSFEVVSRWAASGVPLKVAFKGIDRYFERYYRKGPRRRPVKIDFCEADVLDVFDEWRRAIGLTAVAGDPSAPAEADTGERGNGSRGPSLRAHLERVLARLTTARVQGALGEEADGLLDRISADLDAARGACGVRGDARRALVARLSALDAELLELVKRTLPATDRAAVEADADAELAPFRSQMAPDAYARARATAVDRLVRERAGLPTISLP